jgi:hypothetical protein
LYTRISFSISDAKKTGNFHVKLLDEHWIDIKNSLNVDDTLLAWLVTDGVITNDEKDTIKASCL